MWLSNEQPSIPADLCDAEIAVYDTLLEALKNRAVKGTKPPHLVVITDLAKDYDDLMAMVLLAELHRLGLVELEAFVANLEPAWRRANFGRGALDLLGLQSIPIASGTKGTEKPYNLNDYEFEDCAFIGPQNRENFEAGESLLKRVCQRAVDENRKITLILLSSLMDISQFAHKHRQLLEDAVDRISMQGGVYRDKKGHLEADNLAANNYFSLDHAMHFTKFIQDTNIHTTVYTKVAAFATKIHADFFAELADTRHPLGIHLRKTQLAQDVNFYKATMAAETRFQPFMTQQWFLKNRSTWFTNHSDNPAVEPYPPPEKVEKYLTAVVAYDALAALGGVGDDVLDTLRVLKPDTEGSTCRVIGVCPSVNTPDAKEDPGVYGKQMAAVIKALVKGSLICSRGR